MYMLPRQPYLKLRIIWTMTKLHSDIWPQGTAATAVAGVYGALAVQGKPFKELAQQRIVVVGAGSAGMGVARMLALGMVKQVLCQPPPPSCILIWHHPEPILFLDSRRAHTSCAWACCLLQVCSTVLSCIYGISTSVSRHGDASYLGSTRLGVFFPIAV